MISILLKARKLLKGKKTNITGIVGIVTMLLEQFGYLDLDMTVEGQIAIWLGSVGLLTVRAAIAELMRRVENRLR